MTLSGICQTDTASKVSVNRMHVLELIKDAEKSDLLQAEIDTLSGMYVDLYNKAALQDSLIKSQRTNLQICQGGWQDCESIVSLQKRDMDELKYRFKTRQKIYQAVAVVLFAALIIK